MKSALVLLALVYCASGAIVPQEEVMLLPTFAPETPINDTKFEFTGSFIEGTAELIQTVIYGLDSMTDTLTINILQLSIAGGIDLPSAQAKGNYKADGTIFLSNGTNIVLLGEGQLDASGTGLKLEQVFVDLSVNASGYIRVDDISFVPHIAGCAITTTGDSANGAPVDWVTFCQDIPTIIDEEFPKRQEEVFQLAINIGNTLLDGVTLADVLCALLGTCPTQAPRLGLRGH